MEEEEDIKGLYSRGQEEVSFTTTDEYGFITDKFRADTEFYSSTKMHWFLLLDTYGQNIKKLRLAVRKNHLLEKGIPLSLKSRLWREFLSPKQAVNYDKLGSECSSYEYQIHVDIQRTFRRHFLFSSSFGKGQSELFHLLVSLANHRKSIGYCQGMSDICAVLLMYFEEEEAFEMCVGMFDRDDLWGLFDKNLSKLPRIIQLQDSVFNSAIPQIYGYLKNNGVDISVYGVGWYMTLFSRFNIKLLLRLWDFLFFHGFNILIYFAAAILRYYEKEIFALQGESLMVWVSKVSDHQIDEDIIISIAVNFLELLSYKHIQ